MSNNSSAKTTEQLQKIQSHFSGSSETDSTASSTSIANEKRSQLRIEDVPVIDLSKVEFLEKLGEGAFGKVRLCKIKNGNLDNVQQNLSAPVKSMSSITMAKATGKDETVNNTARKASSSNEDDVQLCAIKILSKNAIIKAKQVDHVFNEMALQQSLNHPFIANLKGIQQDARSLYLVMDFIDGGELYKLIQQREKLDISLSRFYASQIILTFEYLHGKNLIYRDLKPENVLIHQSGYLKLSDFGFIKRIQEGERTYTICGTPEYLAPEIIMNKGHGKPVDWYCLGIFIYEMLVGACPFMNDDPFEIFKKIIQTKISFPKDFDKGAKSLIRHLTDHDLSKRYGNLKHGVEDIKNHRFFRNLSFYNIITQAVEPSYIPTVNPLRLKKHILKQKGTTSKYIPENREEVGGSPAVPADQDPFLKWF